MKKKANESGEAMVTMRLFKDGERYREDVFVAVNGQTCRIRRGETVQVKKKFAEVLERSMEQDGRTADLVERETDAFAREAKKLGV